MHPFGATSAGESASFGVDGERSGFTVARASPDRTHRLVMEFEPCDRVRFEVDGRMSLRLTPMEVGNAVASKLLAADDAVRLSRADP